MSSQENLAPQDPEQLLNETEQYFRAAETPLDSVLYAERLLALPDGEVVSEHLDARDGLEDTLGHLRVWLINHRHSDGINADLPLKRSYTELPTVTPAITVGDVERGMEKPTKAETVHVDTSHMVMDTANLNYDYKKDRPEAENKAARTEAYEETEQANNEEKANLADVPDVPNEEQTLLLRDILRAQEARLLDRLAGAQTDDSPVLSPHMENLIVNTKALEWVDGLAWEHFAHSDEQTSGRFDRIRSAGNSLRYAVVAPVVGAMVLLRLR